MKTAIMQPYFFPYIGYWQLINSVDQFLVYDDVNYIKNGWINRNNILLNGQKHLITVPLEAASPFLHINQIKILKDKVKKEKLIKTVEHSYKKAPYYEEIFKIFYETIYHPSENISEANFFAIKEISKYLNINTKFILSSKIEKDEILRGQDKVISICKQLNTDTYINAIGGLSLYSKEAFKNAGIELFFIKTEEIKYNQFKNEYVPYLSIIDILMFNDKETIKNFLEAYTLI